MGNDNSEKLAVLIARLKELAAGNDPYIDHIRADEALLQFINNKDVIDAFNLIQKWYG